MAILDKLLAPYTQAMSGQATPLDYLKQDPIYGTLFPDPITELTGQNRQGGAGVPVAGGMNQLARQIERLGFDVGELEGFQGEGQISSGHAPNSYHYRGRAGDVNYRGGGRWNNEAQALNWLANWINRRYDPQELFYPGHDPVGGHSGHLHMAF